MLIAGNWKMYKGPDEAGAFCRHLRHAELPAGVDTVVCPPYVSLGVAVQVLAGTEIGVFAQNCHWEHDGAFPREAHELVKSVLEVPVLYGGSVKPGTATDLLVQPGVDGALVGGASLDLDSFVAICRAASLS